MCRSIWIDFALFITNHRHPLLSPSFSAAKASDASHAVTDVVHAAKSQLGNYTYAAWRKVDAAQYAKLANGTCNPAAKPLKPVTTFAIDGSGLILPFYSGVVQGLQTRGVLTADVMRSAKFGGLSGGSITSLMTALGYSGQDQFDLFLGALAAMQACLAVSGGDPLACTLNSDGVPIYRASIAARYPGNTAAETVNGRLTIWTCGVDVMSTTIENSVAQGTNKVGRRERERQRWQAPIHPPPFATLAPLSPIVAYANGLHRFFINFFTNLPQLFLSGPRSTTSSPT